MKNEQLAYLCETIDKIKYTDEFIGLKKEYEKLNNNAKYMQICDKLELCEKYSEEYFSLKKSKTIYEHELRVFEKEVNLAIKEIYDIFKKKCIGENNE